MVERPRILCVDDEPKVLDGLSLQLGRHYQVVTATSGASGLDVLATKGPFAVVMSDMRMPGMDGATFLSRVRSEAPDAIRMLLTGYSDIDSAISAVNEGQVFRFLAKPCPPDHLRQAFAAAVDQHRLLTAEKVLLEQTLRGSIKTLIDILSLTNPTAFGRATRIRDYSISLAKKLGLTNTWQLEVAAMLSQLGTVVLPEATLENHFRGQALTAQEQEMVAKVPVINHDLLANIPRLETVREWIAQIGVSLAVGESGYQRFVDQSLELKILCIASDFDKLEMEGLSTQEVLGIMLGREGWYDPEVLSAFGKIRQAKTNRQVREVRLSSVTAGMVLVSDVRTTSGVLVLARGHQFTIGSIERLRNYPKNTLREPIRVTD